MQIQERSIKEQYYSINQIMRNRKKTNINHFKCPHGNTANKLCINNQCRFEAVFCDEKDCTSCQQMHEDCMSSKISQMKDKIQKRKKLRISTAKSLASIEEKNFKNYIKQTSQFLRHVQQGKYDQLTKDLRFFEECEGKSGMCGGDINRLFDALVEKKYNKQIKTIIDNYIKKVKETMEQLQIEREALFNSVFGVKPEKFPYNYREKLQQSEFSHVFCQSTEVFEGSSFLLPIVVEEYSFPSVNQKHQQVNLPPISQQEIESSFELDKKEEYSIKMGKQQQKESNYDDSSQSEKSEPNQTSSIDPEIPQNITIDSNILRNHKRGSLKEQYLIQQLQRPKMLELIFRASDHNFNAKTFHQICNHKKETVCIIKTQFNRMIACYAQPQWRQRGDRYNFVKDEQKKSFLLQLDQMKRFDLIERKQKNALFCHPNLGPAFGSDIVICHQCNIFAQSRTNFPDCYNNLSSKLPKNQKSKKFLCGTTQKDGTFKVLQYEVFKVIR